MIQLHFDENQLNIGESMGVLHLFAWNYVNYANMEGFRRDSHILFLYFSSTILKKLASQPVFIYYFNNLLFY